MPALQAEAGIFVLWTTSFTALTIATPSRSEMAEVLAHMRRNDFQVRGHLCD